MREIEIKAQTSNLQAVIDTLSKQGVAVSEPVTQHDQVFGLPGEKGDNINQAPWLRIRTEKSGSNQKIILTLKKSVTSQLDSIEHETEITDASEAERIILHLGFEPYVTVVKTRRTAQFGDVELCMDEVEGLGAFVEAEKLTNDHANYDDTINELWNVFGQVGIIKKQEILDGYDVLIRNKEQS